MVISRCPVPHSLYPPRPEDLHHHLLRFECPHNFHVPKQIAQEGAFRLAGVGQNKLSTCFVQQGSCLTRRLVALDRMKSTDTERPEHLGSTGDHDTRILGVAI